MISERGRLARDLEEVPIGEVVLRCFSMLVTVFAVAVTLLVLFMKWRIILIGQKKKRSILYCSCFYFV